MIVGQDVFYYVNLVVVNGVIDNIGRLNTDFFIDDSDYNVGF